MEDGAGLALQHKLGWTGQEDTGSCLLSRVKSPLWPGPNSRSRLAGWASCSLPPNVQGLGTGAPASNNSPSTIPKGGQGHTALKMAKWLLRRGRTALERGGGSLVGRGQREGDTHSLGPSTHGPAQPEGPLPGLRVTNPAAAPHPPHWEPGAWWKDTDHSLHDQDPHLRAGVWALTQHPTPRSDQVYP